jgi:hypothetical protein
MARVANWRAKEVFSQVLGTALEEANAVMDDLVEQAKMKCPVSPIERQGGWSHDVTVSFTPKSGKNKGKTLSFKAKRWLGRQPGDLRRTIRKVTKHDRLGNIRVYAGNTKIYWAFMVERGTRGRPGAHFLKNAFEYAKANTVKRITERLR